MVIQRILHESNYCFFTMLDVEVFDTWYKLLERASPSFEKNPFLFFGAEVPTDIACADCRFSSLCCTCSMPYMLFMLLLNLLYVYASSSFFSLLFIKRLCTMVCV